MTRKTPPPQADEIRSGNYDPNVIKRPVCFLQTVLETFHSGTIPNAFPVSSRRRGALYGANRT